MGDGVDMETEAVAEAGRRLQTSGERLDTSWSAAQAAIDGYEGGIGAGRLAEAFRGNYRTASDAARANADPMPGRFAELSTATSMSVHDYAAVNDMTAELFRRLLAGGQ
jgi:hypothetical protein